MGYNATHGVPQLTVEDYVTSRYILKPMRIWDCDRPVNASAAYLFTTAERARDMQQRPVYTLQSPGGDRPGGFRTAPRWRLAHVQQVPQLDPSLDRSST